MADKKQKDSSSSIRRGIKVRHYIYDLILKNPTSSIKVPSSPQLAKMFDVARSTVTLELKELVEEGIIIGRRGIGTYTNPKAVPAFQHAPGRKIIGIVFGDGANLYWGYWEWALQSYIGLELTPDIAHPRAIGLESGSIDGKYDEIIQKRLDGLIWIAPMKKQRPLLLRLRDSGLPVVTCNLKVEGLPGVGIDYSNSGLELGNILIREKKKRILMHDVSDNIHVLINGARQTFDKRSVKPDFFSVLPSSFDWLEQMEEIILNSKTTPDVIHAHGENVYAIWELIKKYDLDLFEKCAVIASWQDSRRLEDFKGIIHKPPFEKIAVSVAAKLGDLLEGKINNEYEYVKEEFNLKR